MKIGEAIVPCLTCVLHILIQDLLIKLFGAIEIADIEADVPCLECGG